MKVKNAEKTINEIDATLNAIYDFEDAHPWVLGEKFLSDSKRLLMSYKCVLDEAIDNAKVKIKLK